MARKRFDPRTSFLVIASLVFLGVLVGALTLGACEPSRPTEAPTAEEPPSPPATPTLIATLAPSPTETPTAEESPTPTSTATPTSAALSPSNMTGHPSSYDNKVVEVSGQTYLTDIPPRLFIDGKSGVNITGSTAALQKGFYRLKGVYDADSNTLNVAESVKEEAKYLAIEAAKELGINLVPVSVRGLVATMPKEVANVLTSYLSIPNFPQDVPIYPYVVYARDGFYLALSDTLVHLPAEVTFLYEGEDYGFTFSSGEVKGTLVKTPLEQISFGSKWQHGEFGGVIIAESIRASDPVSATVRQISNDPASFAFERVSIAGSYLVATATVDYSEIKVPFGVGILADSPTELFFEERGPRLETIDPERKVWQLRQAQVIGTVLYPTEEVLKYLAYSAPLTEQDMRERVKPALFVDTLVDDVVAVADISELNPLIGNPRQYWGKVVEFDGYALGANIRLKDVVEAIVQTEIPINVNMLAMGFADSPSIGSQLAIIGLNNELLDEGGETILGRFMFRVAVSEMPIKLVDIESADTAFFLLSKEELPIEIPSELYSLSVSVNPSGAGSVTPPGGDFASGTDVVITAVPAIGYAFDHWSGDSSGIDNPTSITMESDKSVTAHFTAITLQSIQLSPASAPIAAGNTQQFTATGSYSDGSTKDITSTAIWISSNPAVATVVPGGLATGVSSGTATITATVGTVQGSASLTVITATLQSIQLSPASASIAAGNTQQFTATGSYSDRSTKDITSIAIWTSSNPAVTTVAPGGLAIGVSSGTATITATVGTVQGSASLTVTLF